MTLKEMLSSGRLCPAMFLRLDYLVAFLSTMSMQQIAHIGSMQLLPLPSELREFCKTGRSSNGLCLTWLLTVVPTQISRSR
mmetsp:Transcript_86120/g.165771  ORF Transcript_86120/g.165771 Transcript_86120/m.165771 type:complete len:81 (-) Transcript_86120:8-250(-)